MYRFVDRHVAALPEPAAFLLAAMRVWCETVERQRCLISALRCAFVRQGAIATLNDFLLAMTIVHYDGLFRLNLAQPGARFVGEDEAKLLAAIEAAVVADGPRLRRIAASLVAEYAVERFAVALEGTATHLGVGRPLAARAGE